jgi:hypothetical protein
MTGESAFAMWQFQLPIYGRLLMSIFGLGRGQVRRGWNTRLHSILGSPWMPLGEAIAPVGRTCASHVLGTLELSCCERANRCQWNTTGATTTSATCLPTSVFSSVPRKLSSLIMVHHQWPQHLISCSSTSSTNIY